MKAGIPPNDSVRAPWLATLNKRLASILKAGRHPVEACSTIKDDYCAKLRRGIDGLQFVYLKGCYDLIRSRMLGRREHYMGPGMLRSQFEALEEPVDALTVDVALSPDEIIKTILNFASYNQQK